MTKTIESKKVPSHGGCLSGLPVRLQQRGKAFDVVYCTGFCWKYVVKGVSEQAARNEFFLLTVEA